MLSLDITTTPFSRYGSYLSISSDTGSTSLVIRHVRHKWGQERAFRLFFCIDGQRVAPAVSASPGHVLVTQGRARARLYLHTDNGLVIESSGFEIDMLSYDGFEVFGNLMAENRYHFIAGMGMMNAQLQVQTGTLVPCENPVAAGTSHQGPTHQVSLNIYPVNTAIVLFLHVSIIESRQPDAQINPDRDIAAIEAEWNDFAAKMPRVNSARKTFAESMWFTLWSSFVRAEGYFTRDACLMSKGAMTGVWSWDHCFNALALSRGDLRLGLNQFFLMFDHQADIGHLPDFMCGSSFIWSVSKPPVHGLFFDQIMSEHKLERSVLEEAYSRLTKWTEWWFEFRDTDHDGIPHYNVGVDSGWDNATIFDSLNEPLESPDLSAFLVLQMRCLGRIAATLGQSNEAESWHRRATDLLDRLIAHSWQENGFAALTTGSHSFDPSPTSLLPLMVLVLGNELDPVRRKVVVDNLIKNFLTPHGAASEMAASKKYTPDGYWRGPVWAPVVYLLVDGLRRGGETELARSLADRFCTTVEQSGGIYENYDAITGKGLRDQGYTWTASAVLLLLNEYSG